MSKVPVQKGEIKPDYKTYKNSTHREKSSERMEEMKGLQKGKDLEYRTPKK